MEEFFYSSEFQDRDPYEVLSAVEDQLEEIRHLVYRNGRQRNKEIDKDYVELNDAYLDFREYILANFETPQWYIEEYKSRF